MASNAVEAFKAYADAQIGLINALADSTLKRAQALRATMEAGVVEMDIAFMQRTLRQYEVDLRLLNQRRKKAEDEGKRLQERAIALGILLAPPSGDRQGICNRGFAAMRYFIARNSDAVISVLAKTVPGSTDSRTVGQLIESLEQAGQLPHLGTPEWVALAEVVSALAKGAEEQAARCEKLVEELPSREYKLWEPIKILESCQSSVSRESSTTK
jgi:hypothetical protein